PGFRGQTPPLRAASSLWLRLRGRAVLPGRRLLEPPTSLAPMWGADRSGEPRRRAVVAADGTHLSELSMIPPLEARLPARVGTLEERASRQGRVLGLGRARAAGRRLGLVGGAAWRGLGASRARRNRGVRGRRLTGFRARLICLRRRSLLR